MNLTPKLIRQCRKGNRKAQNQLYQSCFGVLMGVCSRYKQDEQEAMAMLNQGFLKILDNLDKYQEQIPFEAWIRRIMINTLIDDFRKHRKVKELMEYRDFTEETNHYDQIDFNRADQELDAEQINQLILELPPVSQKVFNLFAIDGYSHKEIADLLEISIGTSKWHLSFARKKLQEKLAVLLENSRVIRQ